MNPRWKRTARARRLAKRTQWSLATVFALVTLSALICRASLHIQELREEARQRPCTNVLKNCSLAMHDEK